MSDAADAVRKIKIDDVGIGSVLMNSQLTVPPNQREYAWTEDEVEAIFNDLQKAIDEPRPSSYFLGTIALTGRTPNRPEVTDGQQRLATTTILLAAMRDYFHELGDEFNRDYLETQYLRVPSPEEQRQIPRLTLNVDDRAYFAKLVVERPDHPSRSEKPTKRSHQLIHQAYEMACERIALITDPYKKQVDKTNRLKYWRDYLTNDALVIVLRLPSDLNAFKMFETLNNRGLRTTQLDIVKSYLFREADTMISEVQPAWSRLMARLDGLDGNNVPLTFLRHFVITKMGMTRAEEVYEKIEGEISGKVRAGEYVAEMESNANDYAAIVEPENKKWNNYVHGVKNSIRTLRYLGVVHTRPLLLAALRNFTSPKDVERTFRLVVNWTVRFVIVGGGRSGTLEESYAKAAHDITRGKIKNAKALLVQIAPIVPNDPVFKEAFGIARVTKNNLARYYLRALQLKQDGMTKEPEWIPNDDGTDINLEHVLPENPADNWPGLTTEMIETLWNRLGNMVLLKSSKNSDLANKSFAEKQKALKQSAYSLTSLVAHYPWWDEGQIGARQAILAGLAAETWPIDVK